ncbi:hypothetical protein [Fictibacillus terranigra]|uniref:Uncharacterized protein n=1 Tax=Fictibacillus terranigra TaxID=3058424 RepID=A0ABT8E5A2_9BACL|nr:hypothetical protein [Fictibacillus sp. CENA-BCM004]MDN4073086.1 hypothetical protein [Fictibacillus sp. CENA-BCM004]
MEIQSKQLYARFKDNEGKNFDAILQNEHEGNIGFGFMNTIKNGIVRAVNKKMIVSEPKTANYFSLPLWGVENILDESCGEYDIAFTVTYVNSYQLFIQIYEPY